MSTGGELEEVQSGDLAGLNTGDVSESLHQTGVLVVDNEGTSSLSVSPVPHLTLTGSDLSGVGDLDDVRVGLDGLEKVDGGLGLLVSLDVGADDEGDLRELLDSVTSGEDERREGRGSQSRGDGVSSLVLVDLNVPLSPRLGRGEHSTTSAHVTESGLTGSGSTGTRDTGNSSNSSTSTPGLGRGLLTGLGGDGVSLSSVLGHGLWRREKGRNEEISEMHSIVFWVYILFASPCCSVTFFAVGSPFPILSHTSPA